MGLLQKRSGGTIYLSGDSLGSSDTLYITSGSGTNTGRAIKILQSNSGAALHVTGTVGSGCFIVNSAYNAHPTLYSSGPAYFNGGNDNSGKADFSVDTGGTPSWSLNGCQFQVGGTDINWSLRARPCDIGTWANSLTIHAGSNGSSSSYNLALQTATSSNSPTTYVCLCGSDATLYLGTGNIRNAALHNCFIIGGNYTNNAYNSTTGARLLFGGGNDTGNYFIGTNLENYGGNYNKLDIRWHTGIRIGAQPGYGGTRFYNNEDLGCVIFSVGQDNAHIKACNGAIIYGCTCMQSPVFYGTSCLSTPTICSSTNSYYLNFNTGNLNIGTGYINSIANSASCFKLIFNNGTGTCICDMTRTPFLAMNGTGDKLCIGGGWFRGGSTYSWLAGVLGFNFTASNTTTNTACIPQTHSNCAGYAGIIFGGYDTGLSFYTCCGNTTAGTAVEGPTNAGGGIANKRLQITGNGCVYIDNQLFYNSSNCYYYMTKSLSVSQAADFQGIAIGCTYTNIGSWHTQLSLYGSNHSVTRWNMGYGSDSADNSQNNCIYAHSGQPFTMCSSGNIKLKPGTGTVCVCGHVCMPVNQYTTYGPNSTWGAYLRVGGNGNTVQGCNSCLYASVVATDGNLHLDAGVGKGLYLNFYDGSYIYFGNGANGIIGCVTSACLYHCNVICSNHLRAAANMCTPLLYLTGVNTPIICGPAGHFVISTDSNCSMVGTTYSTRCFAFNGSCFKQTCELINSNCVQSPVLCATSYLQTPSLCSPTIVCVNAKCYNACDVIVGSSNAYACTAAVCDWYILGCVNESNSPQYWNIKTAAHNTLAFNVTTGYHGSNVASIVVLNQTTTHNGSYIGVRCLRVVKPTSGGQYEVQALLCRPTAPACCGTLYISVCSGNNAYCSGSSMCPPVLPSSLCVGDAGCVVMSSVYTGGTGFSTGCNIWSENLICAPTICGTEVCAGNWLRTTNINTGLYNTATGVHAYSVSSDIFRLYPGSNNTIALQGYTCGASRGCISWNCFNQIHMHDMNGNVRFLVNAATDIRLCNATCIYGTLVTTGKATFSATESINFSGARGTFGGEFMHLYRSVGIGHPNGWGCGSAETPQGGLSTYGGICIGYGCGVATPQTFRGKNMCIGCSSSWDNGSLNGTNTTITNVHFQGHNDFWIGAGNATWWTTASTGHHDLLINTMTSGASNPRGITFTASNAGTSAYRLGRWRSVCCSAASALLVDGKLGVGLNGANTLPPESLMVCGSARFICSTGGNWIFMGTTDSAVDVGLQRAGGQDLRFYTYSGGWNQAFRILETCAYACTCLQSPILCATSSVRSSCFLGCITASGNGASNTPFRLATDYNSWLIGAAPGAGCACATWGLFWAGNSGAAFGTNGTCGPGNIWGNSGNPNEFVFVGGNRTDWVVWGACGKTWQRNGATICCYACTCQFKTNDILSVGAACCQNCTASGYVIGKHAVIPGTGWSYSGTSTGRVEIGLPTLNGEGGSAHLGMVHVVVDVYEYNNNGATTYVIGGHNWNCGWYSCTANRAAGCNPKGIKLAYHSCGGTNNGRYVILIGEPGDTWSYGSVHVRRISNGLYYCSNMDMGTDMYIKQVTCADSWYNCTTNDLTAQGTNRVGYLAATGRITTDLTGTCSIRSCGGVCVLSDWYRIAGGGGLYFSSYTAGIHGGGTGVVCAYNNGSFCSNASTGWGLRSQGCILAGSCIQANVNVCAGCNLVTGNAVYVGEWVRFNSANRGMYWDTNCKLHLYPAVSNCPMLYLRSCHSNTGIVLTTNANTTPRGYFYGDSSNNIGILDSDGSWAIRHLRDACTEFRINNSVYATLYGNCFCSANIICAATCLRAPTVCATGCVTAPTVYSNGANMTSMAQGCCFWRFFMVCGDADTFYPVCYNRGNTFGYKRYSINRSYNSTAPDTWYTSTHKGGLNYTWEQTSDTQWGGNDRSFRVNQVRETYTSVIGGHVHTVSGGIVLLRGGGAIYCYASDAMCTSCVCVYDGTGGTDSQGMPHSTCTYFIPGNCACVCALTCANAQSCRNSTICNSTAYPLQMSGVGNSSATTGCFCKVHSSTHICAADISCGSRLIGTSCVQAPYMLATNCVHACCGITFTHSNWSGEKTKIQAHSVNLYFQNYNSGCFAFRNCGGCDAAYICQNGGIHSNGWVRSSGYIQTGSIFYPWSQSYNCVRHAVGNAAGNGWICPLLICRGGNVEFPISGYNVVKCCGNIIACQGTVIARPNTFNSFHTPFCAEYGYNAAGTTAWRLYIGGSYTMQASCACNGTLGYLLYSLTTGGRFNIYNSSGSATVTLCGSTGAVCATCFVGDGSNLTGVGGGTETSCTHSSYSGTTGITLDITHKTHVLPLASGAVITGFTYSNRSSSGTVDTITLVVKYSGTASITWTNVVWSGGVTPTLTGTSGKADVFVLTSYNGSYWVGTIAATNLDSTNL